MKRTFVGIVTGVVLGCAQPSAPVQCPCAQWGTPSATGTIQDASLEELSGLVASRRHAEVLWALEDSGNPPQVVALGPDGAVRARINVQGATNVDWEDLAAGPCGADTCLYIGDIGDNTATRTDAAVLRIAEPNPALGDQFVAADRFALAYPDGAQDAESLVVLPDGRVRILTKRADDTARVYEFPSLDATATSTLTLVQSISTGAGSEGLGAMTTGADVDPASGALLVRTYAHIWSFPALGADGTWDPATRESLPAHTEPQGEAVAWDGAACGYWQVSEGTSPSLYETSCQAGR